ncbi:hypothetical protein [Halomarina rubra]|uniref:Major capsid protein n=1 Tax=Halomarina rubra TaxID=2071873 RepID=A0ABD6ASH7_9EURY|nr:hypothetical protein [Halomarina rubra]
MTTILEAINGTHSKDNSAAREVFEKLMTNWGFPEEAIEQGYKGVNLSARIKHHERGDGYADHLEKTFGTRHPFLAGAAAGYKCGGEDYQPGSGHAIKSADAMIEKGVVDASTVQAASPVAVDPDIVDIQRGAAPVLDIIATEAQAGFKAKYNVLSDRQEPVGMLTESDAIDLSDQGDKDQTLQTDEKDMKIYVDKVNLSDFTQRAEQSLGYLDVRQLTLGQRVKAHALFKAKQIFYGDPSVGDGTTGVQSTEAYEGLAKIASDAGNQIDKSGYAGSGNTPLLDDLKNEVTKIVEDSGATYDDLTVLVSPTFFDELENEGNVTTRLSGYDENINFGGRSITIKQNVQVRECPNIRAYGDLTGTASGGNFDASNRDVFIIDTSATRFRVLAPLSTVPLGRVGLADRAALFEYGTLISKDHGAHMRYLSSYAAQ